MVKIINGKRYNTETATMVDSWDNGLFQNDFGYCYEELYITKKENWFLHGKGGALSVYKENYGNGICGGEKIIPYSKEDAKKWLEKRGTVMSMEKYFPDEIEDA